MDPYTFQEALAKKEAEQFKVDYWHGALLEQKLKEWQDWNSNHKISKSKSANSASVQIKVAQSQVSATTETICACGAPMLIRKSKEGKQFWGCTNFPNCRRTKNV